MVHHPLYYCKINELSMHAPPVPYVLGPSPWWGVSGWCGRPGSSWRCPHSWCIHPPYLGWPGASRKNTGRHNTVRDRKELQALLEATILRLSAKIYMDLGAARKCRRRGKGWVWHSLVESLLAFIEGAGAKDAKHPTRQIFCNNKELSHQNCHYHPLWGSEVHFTI